MSQEENATYADYRADSNIEGLPISVTEEGVESVAVYTVAGSLVASSASNTVDVADLSNGIYVVKANIEAGVITGQIVKK